MSGYAKAWRGRWDHPLFKNKQEAAVWAWMCDCARFRRQEMRTAFGMVTLERGQILISQRNIEKEFGLGRQRIRRLFGDLEDSGMIEQNSTHSAAKAGTIVTIVKYEEYQGVDDSGGSEETQGRDTKKPIENPRPTQDQPTREESKEREEGRRDSADAESLSPEHADAITAIAKLTVLLAKPDTFPTVEAFAMWNRYAKRFGWKCAGKLNPDRRAKLRRRLQEVGGISPWEDALQRAAASDWLSNGTPPTWWNIDFLIRNDSNIQKLLDGNYDRKYNGNGSGSSAADRYRDECRDPVLDDLAKGRDSDMDGPGYVRSRQAGASGHPA